MKRPWFTSPSLTTLCLLALVPLAPGQTNGPPPASLPSPTPLPPVLPTLPAPAPVPRIVAPSPSSLPAGSQALTNTYLVGERGPHHRVWHKLTTCQDAQGQTFTQTNSAYTELASGMSYLSGGQWVDSREEFQITANGYAVATQGLHQVIISPVLNDAQGAVDLLTPDGQRLRSTLLGLSLSNRLTGQTLTVAETTNAVGQQTAPNEILFTNCFSGFAGSVRYVYQKGGFHQDVVLAERIELQALKAAGFDPEASDLQIWTEFLAAPEPLVHPRGQARTNSLAQSQAAQPDRGEDLAFGAMIMPEGKAYLAARTGSDPDEVVVSPRWVRSGARQFLVESVPLKALAPLFAQLSPRRGPPGLPRAERLYANQPTRPERRPVVGLDQRAMPSASLPQSRLQAGVSAAPRPRLTRKTTETILALAKHHPTASAMTGLVLDYVILNGWAGNFTFRGDTTYLVSGYFGIWYGNVATFEGGTVIKFPEDGTGGPVYLYGPVICQTAPYRLAVCTSKNDNSIGEAISGSTGAPTMGSSTYLYNNSAEGTVLQYLRLAFAGCAIKYDCDVWHSQFVQCGIGLSLSTRATLRNVLFARCPVAVSPPTGGYGVMVMGEHLTVDQCQYFMAPPGTGWNQAWLTNSLFTAVTNLDGAQLSWCRWATNGAGIYANSGAGGYYLAPASTNRHAGTTNINVALLADLRQKTTQPPIVYSNEPVSKPAAG